MELKLIISILLGLGILVMHGYVLLYSFKDKHTVLGIERPDTENGKLCWFYGIALAKRMFLLVAFIVIAVQVSLYFISPLFSFFVTIALWIVLLFANALYVMNKILKKRHSIKTCTQLNTNQGTSKIKTAC